MLTPSLLLSLSANIAALPAQSAVASELGSVLEISGEVRRGDAAILRKLLAEQHFDSVRMESPGGDLIESLRIGYEIRKHGLSTYVAADKTCASACSLMWLAGTQLYSHERAKIGFHLPYYRKSGRVSDVGATIIGHYLADMGYDMSVSIFYAGSGRALTFLSPTSARAAGFQYKLL